MRWAVIFECFRRIREIDHFAWILLCYDWNISEEGIMGVFEIVDTRIFVFLMICGVKRFLLVAGVTPSEFCAPSEIV